jgi:hypothetical protein
MLWSSECPHPVSPEESTSVRSGMQFLLRRGRRGAQHIDHGGRPRCALRPGNVHSAEGWDGVLKPVVERYKGKVSRI